MNRRERIGEVRKRTDVPLQVLPDCKGNLTDLRRILYLSLAKGNPNRML
jgi:hypothetical protein